MFLKKPRESTDQRVRSLLQKAARRGYRNVVELALKRLNFVGDNNWLRSRAIVITYEECWPLASRLRIDREFASRRSALLDVAKSAKQKDAASLGALAYALAEGDRSVLDIVPDSRDVKIVAEALARPSDFFSWVTFECRTSWARDVVEASKRYLPAATWQWDKACIIAGALLATKAQNYDIEMATPSEEDFPYWVALDKHTTEGKVALAAVAKEIRVPYRQIIWASFYFESTCVNRLVDSPWWAAEQRWRFERAGLSVKEAKEMWNRARPLVRSRLENESQSLKQLLEGGISQYSFQLPGI